MNAWLQSVLLVVGLAVGIALGWAAGRRLGFRPPDPWATAGVLLVGSLGGPALTDALLGATPLSHTLALLIAGVAIGMAYQPVSKQTAAASP